MSQNQKTTKKMQHKKLFALTMGIVAYAFISYACGRANANKAKAALSEVFVTLENVEALTRGEGGSSSRWRCWSSTKEDSGDVWMCGNPCTIKEHASGKGSKSWCYSN